MLNFQPLGFIQQALATDLGVMAYYTPGGWPWQGESHTTRPPLVFLHSLGGGSSAFEWSKVYAAFGNTHQVIAPDLIGWGQSTHPPRTYSTEDYFYMITHLLESVAQPPTLVAATSLTAGVVIRLAGLRPDLFKGLFLVSPSGNSDFGRDYKASLPALLASTPGIDKVLYQVGAANELAVRSFLSTFLFADSRRITPETVQGYLTCTQQPNAEYAALASLTGAISFDLSRYIHQLQTPTTIVLGSGSRFTAPATVKRLASLNPKAVQQVIEIPDSGVLPHVEHPAVVVGLLKQFLAKHSA
ncbi:MULTISPECIES: alpha/beta hydrolase [Cyanophyceae]|uniref:alpha/beta fold hydrolase n=1 Tax=Cyanophyceae TaxID=3028117 RepID=UPI00168342A4|nr:MULTISPECIES: alpha/beta hydrolase [Cyanophyceae]MBD1916707.1 alpha/beta hydrolase [Phormidium sp. FACHB-77]MBD2031777.1 alpha/beta hydrolase [Phormidium sp. FACHB-322]MBD2050527.1 alpha/beta hydrolase [Leptolyngbya sp. FACHB-60]